MERIMVAQGPFQEDGFRPSPPVRLQTCWKEAAFPKAIGPSFALGSFDVPPASPHVAL